VTKLEQENNSLIKHFAMYTYSIHMNFGQEDLICSYNQERVSQDSESCIRVGQQIYLDLCLNENSFVIFTYLGNKHSSIVLLRQNLCLMKLYHVCLWSWLRNPDCVPPRYLYS